MPQPITHMFICEQGMRGSAAGADLWNAYPNFARFGSFGPDLFYARGVGFPIDAVYSKAADIMHASGSLAFYCDMMDSIKTIDDQSRCAKMKAFVYGFYSHVVADVVFHPFVYRRTGDHWVEHSQPWYDAHRDLECLVDNYIIVRAGGEPNYSLVDVDLRCHDIRTRLLDEDVYGLYLDGVIDVYKSFSSIIKPWRFTSAERGSNPVQMAYAKYHTGIGLHYAMYRSKRKNVISGKSVVALDQWPQQDSDLINGTDRSNWYPPQQFGGLDYTIEELLTKASGAVARIIDASEGFFGRDVSGTSQEYFSGLDVRFLDDDYNLDTGLPSSLNGDPQNRSDTGERFEFQAQQLASRYAVM